MKIASITTIKNEADIIESFVRYHLNIVDFMLILDNGSTDDTNYILEELIAEGLPVKVIIDTDKYFEPLEKYNFLLKKVIEEYDADIICPIDADEFITTREGNPREYIEKIPNDAFYTVERLSYVPTEDDDEDLFVPIRIQYIRDPSLEMNGKVITTKELYEKYDAGLTIGNHGVSLSKENKKKVNNIKDNGLILAHFPLRSIEQTMSKILTNYPNSLARKVVKSNISYHYIIMFNKIKETGTLDMEDVTDFATQYALRHNKDREDFNRELDIPLIKQPMNIDFCDDIEIKYKYTENPLANLLENNIYLAKEIHNYKNQINVDDVDNKKESNREVEKTGKSSFLDKILSKSNSYVFYKNNYIKLKDENHKLKDQLNYDQVRIGELNDKIKDMEIKIQSLNNKIKTKDNKISKLENKE